MDLFLAGRATASFNGVAIPLQELAQKAAGRWLAIHLPAIDRERQVKVHSLIRPGSADLIDLFARNSGRMRLSNDTSCGVGFAPLSRLERLVYTVEEELGAAALASHPVGSRALAPAATGGRRTTDLTPIARCGLLSTEFRDDRDRKSDRCRSILTGLAV